MFRNDLYKNLIKHFLDKLVAIVLLVITAPLMLFSVICLTYSAKSFNVFFVQLRPGKGGKLFYVIKLKTMRDETEVGEKPLSDKERITKIGRLLRASSIDEIPQLINVLKGEMSLVGPRPLLPEYLSHYTIEQARRHEVRPGITGWAQINGRNTTTFKERFKKDVWYVDNISFILDLKILCITFLKVFNSEGILSQDPNKITDK